MKKTAEFNINTAEYWDRTYRNEADTNKLRVDTARLEQLLRWVMIRFGELDRLPFVLDLGCGAGEVSAYLRRAKPGIRVMGVDISAAAIARTGNLQSPGLEFKVIHPITEANPLPFPDEHFDMAWCGETLEHCDNPNEVIGELIRVTGEGGLIALSTPYRGRNRSPEHVYEFTPQDVAKWGKMAGDLVFLDCRLLDGWLSMFAVLRRCKKEEPS